MIDSLYIAWRYIRYHKVKSGILVVSIACMLFLPLGLRSLVRACERELIARAAATPLIVGAKGSSLDLAIDILYFERKGLEAIPKREADAVQQSGLARAIPLYTRFQAGQQTIVGTTPEYFEFRDLRVTRGRMMTRLGECVLGAAAADALAVGPGDAVISAPENLFDLAGTYPLRMHVTGVFERSHTPDDLAVFVDLKTAWIIEGLGHGHQDLARVDDPDVLLRRNGRVYTANQKLLQYNEITDENLGDFHFHGDTGDFPISAVIAVPVSRKGATLLRGRYQAPGLAAQILRPVGVIRDLTATIFRIEAILHWIFVLVAAATLMLVALVVMLSLRLRRREVQTMYKLGCSRLKTAELLAGELAIIGATAVVCTAGLTVVTTRYVDELLRRLIL
jgi:putative ABC transport system permease protein